MGEMGDGAARARILLLSVDDKGTSTPPVLPSDLLHAGCIGGRAKVVSGGNPTVGADAFCVDKGLYVCSATHVDN